MQDQLQAETVSRDRGQQAALPAPSLAGKSNLIGELAEVMANELNNLMMAISGFAELELKKAPPPARRSLEQVLRNTNRATFLIQKLLAFSRTHVRTPEFFDPNQLISDLKELLQQLAGETIALAVKLDPTVRRIHADQLELEQLLVTLVLNARDAMRPGGTLILSTRLERVEAQQAQAQGTVPGRYVMIAVENTARAAEGGSPDKGSHQGLEMNRSLAAACATVKEAGGMVQVVREPATGTGFKLYFPAVEKEPSTENLVGAAQPAATAGTILVVEDDDAVRVPTAEFLMMQGFKVLQARTGAEALQLAEVSRSPVQLLITDMMMPAMSGMQVAEKLLAMHPGIKVLYMSGDRGAVIAGLREERGHLVLQKPFRLNKLGEQVRTLLES